MSSTCRTDNVPPGRYERVGAIPGGEDPRRVVRDGLGYSVSGVQFQLAGLALAEPGEQLWPRTSCQRMRRLPEIADDRHRRVLGAACDHPALHRRQILGLVENHMQVGVLGRRVVVGLRDRLRLGQHRHVALLAVRVEAVGPTDHPVAFPEDDGFGPALSGGDRVVVDRWSREGDRGRMSGRVQLPSVAPDRS
jgi:hypothetical protein